VISTPQAEKALGTTVEGFHAPTASDDEYQSIKNLVYSEKIVLLKNQHLTPDEFVEMGRRFGKVETYYQPMYAHPDRPEIFVSSNVPRDGKQIGVPQTGKFWHADYQFMPRPFGLTLIYPQVVPTENRGTYFIDMTRAYEQLSPEVKDAIEGTRCEHTARRYFKIRPTDVYRPISEILQDIDRETPPSVHPTVFTHPVTGAKVLYVSGGFASHLMDADGNTLPASLLDTLLESSGQLDTTFTHPNIHLQTFEVGDMLIWDNRALIHRARHATKAEPATSFRVTAHDDHPFYEGIDG
jgi:alpha-ketoglutarate-dependent taurine dioxygenase